MKYIDTPKFGGAEVLTMAEGPCPSIEANEILIEVSAAGVNRPDVIQRSGNYPAPAGASPILGLEVAGKVAAVGSKVSTWKVGEPVCALTNGGGYAEFVAVPEGQCLPIPEGLSMIEAAALPETAFTVWSNVFDRAALKAGEKFLVHGGASGIGTTAIQFARIMGAKAYTTVGSTEKCDACLALGADIAINYHEADFLEVLKKETHKKGIDVILDMVGGEYLQKNLKLAALDGRIINIAYLQGPVAQVNFLPIMLKRLTLSGSTLRPQSADVKTKIAQQLLEHIWPSYANGSIKPIIAAVFPINKAADAHRLMESNQHIGKIVLSFND